MVAWIDAANIYSYDKVTMIIIYEYYAELIKTTAIMQKLLNVKSSVLFDQKTEAFRGP